MVDYRDEAPSALSLVLWFVGLIIVLVGIWVLFTQTELSRFVPMGVVVAILLLVIGIAVMATSDRFRGLGTTGSRYGRGSTVEYERVGTRGAEPAYERREYREDRERYP